MNAAYEIQCMKLSNIKHTHESLEVAPPLPLAQVGTGGFNVQLVPSHRCIPLPAESVDIIHGDGKQNGVDVEIVYDHLHRDVDK